LNANNVFEIASFIASEIIYLLFLEELWGLIAENQWHEYNVNKAWWITVMLNRQAFNIFFNNSVVYCEKNIKLVIEIAVQNIIVLN
jgi:hypothetical protein